MSSPPFKRQRTGPSALTAPFKSPVPRKVEGGLTSTGPADSSAARSTTHSTSTSAAGSGSGSTAAPTSASTSTPPRALNTTKSHTSATPFSTPGPSSSRITPLRASQKPLPPRFSPSFKGDAELRALQSQATSLTRQLQGLRDALDTANQALRLEQMSTSASNGDSSGKRESSGAKTRGDAELVTLTKRWTDAARNAAEELLSIALEKVNAAGGLAAWRKRERERKERREEGWAQDEKDARRGRRGGDGDDGEDDEQEEEEREGYEYEEYGRESDLQRRNDSDGKERDGMRGEGGKDAEEHTFTMDMLLASLGIDLKTIGYDVAEHKWVD